MEGQREETPPRKDFYSKAVTTSQLKEINKCQLQMRKDFPQKSEKSPKKKVASKGDNKAPSKKSRKRKASSSSSSSSSSEEMSVYSEEETERSRSRLSSSSSSTRSRSRSSTTSSNTSSDFYLTAPVSGEAAAEKDIDLSDVSHSEYFLKHFSL